MSNGVQIVVLCEDKQQEVFLWRLLRLMNFNPRRIRVVPYPQGRGCGSQHVKQQYANEVREQRRRRAATALVTAIDADNLSVQDRYRELNDTIAPTRRIDEHICVFIPKHCLETWIAYLTGNTDIVEENQNPPRLRGHESDCAPAVLEYLHWAQRNQTTNGHLPSLDASFAEFARIPQS